MMEYAQPLLVKTDDSVEELNKSMMLAQICWNMALLAEEEREEVLVTLQSDLTMTDEEFLDFRENVIEPMILRHQAMFGDMSQKGSRKRMPPRRPQEKKYHGTGRNEACPCESGKKYKRCCGK